MEQGIRRGFVARLCRESSRRALLGIGRFPKTIAKRGAFFSYVEVFLNMLIEEFFSLVLVFLIVDQIFVA